MLDRPGVFTYRDGVAVVQLIPFTIYLCFAFVLCWRHGFRRSDGWVILVTFSTLRILAACFQLASINNPTRSVYGGALICQGIGLAPLTLLNIGLFGRVLVDLLLGGVTLRKEDANPQIEKQQEQIRQHHSSQDLHCHLLSRDRWYRIGCVRRHQVRELVHSGNQRLAESFRHPLRGVLRRLYMLVSDFPATMESYPRWRAEAPSLLRVLRTLYGGPISVQHFGGFRRKPKVSVQCAHRGRHNVFVHGCP